MSYQSLFSDDSGDEKQNKNKYIDLYDKHKLKYKQYYDENILKYKQYYNQNIQLIYDAFYIILVFMLTIIVLYVL